MNTQPTHTILNHVTNKVHSGEPYNSSLQALQAYAQQLTQATGQIHTAVPLCEHCHKEIARLIDYRGPDVISKYLLCLSCSTMTDEEFFAIERPMVLYRPAQLLEAGGGERRYA